MMLDVGTDNAALLERSALHRLATRAHHGQAYDEFIETFVAAVIARWPNVLLHWEDFARHNATRLLERYRDRLCTFNDDVQGTAAVATGTLLAALAKSGGVLGGSAHRGARRGLGRLRDREPAARRAHRSGTRSGRSASALLPRRPRRVARRRRTPSRCAFQAPFVQPREAVADWKLEAPGRIELLDVVRNAKPTVSIGVTGVAGAFSEAVVREMARHVPRPIIMPLSNPTPLAEATPADLYAWTEGRAIVGVGSPFAPVDVERAARPGRSDEQRVHLPRDRPGRRRGADPAHQRRDVSRRRAPLGGALAGAVGSGRIAAAAAHCGRDVSVSVAEAVAVQAQAEGLAEPLPIDRSAARDSRRDVVAGVPSVSLRAVLKLEHYFRYALR